MTHVFITDRPVECGTRLLVPHVIVSSDEDHMTAYDTMANIQQTLPIHCTVGLCGLDAMGHGIMIVAESVNGLDKQFNPTYTAY